MITSGAALTNTTANNTNLLNMDKLTPILKRLPKLNQRLQLTFENMKSTPTSAAAAAATTTTTTSATSSSIVADFVAAAGLGGSIGTGGSSSSSSSLPPSALETNSLKREIQLIDEKWRKYLEQAQQANNSSAAAIANAHSSPTTAHHLLTNDLASKISFFQNMSNQQQKSEVCLFHLFKLVLKSF